MSVLKGKNGDLQTKGKLLEKMPKSSEKAYRSLNIRWNRRNLHKKPNWRLYFIYS